MMPSLMSYSVRNLLRRKLTTLLTAGGMALVVFVFAAVLMLSEGLRQTLVATGSDDNVIVIRKGSTTEVQSSIERLKTSILETLPQIATGETGQRLVAKELVVLIGLPKKETGKPSNVVIRGIDAASLLLRPQVRIVKGRMPKPGSSEIMVGTSIAKRFSGSDLGQALRFGMRDWTIVGIFDAGNTGFSSEIWGDADQLIQAFRRSTYSSVLFRLQDRKELASVQTRLEEDPRLQLEAKRETKYYEEQSEMMAKFLNILGLTLTIIFSLGAIIGAMITMYAAVANRTVEIGTLRAVGFRRTSILSAFMMEALFLGLIGGLTGIVFAAAMQFVTISTVNFQTFSELAFQLTLTARIVVQSLLFSLIMGLIGGLLPAVRAARMKIVDALRAS